MKKDKTHLELFCLEILVQSLSLGITSKIRNLGVNKQKLNYFTQRIKVFEINS